MKFLHEYCIPIFALIVSVFIALPVSATEPANIDAMETLDIQDVQLIELTTLPGEVFSITNEHNFSSFYEDDSGNSNYAITELFTSDVRIIKQGTIERVWFECSYSGWITIRNNSPPV